MHDVVRRTALPGPSQSSHDRLARRLGYFSIALGVAELIAPRAICRAAGLKDLEPVIRGYGAREIATGVAILGSHDPEPWMWTRVAGDLADIATVAAGARQDNESKGRNALAVATLAADDVGRPGLRQRIASRKRQPEDCYEGLQRSQRVSTGPEGRKGSSSGFQGSGRYEDAGIAAAVDGCKRRPVDLAWKSRRAADQGGVGTTWKDACWRGQRGAHSMQSRDAAQRS